MKTQEKVLLFVMFVSLGVVFLVYSYIGTYSRFMADDFCSFYDAKRLDVLRYIWYWYIMWGGRYSAIATDNLIQYIGPYRIGLVPVIVLVTFIMSAFIMFQHLLKKKVSERLPVVFPMIMAAVITFAIVTLSPQSQQVFYWWNGMRTYVPAINIFNLHVAYLYWASSRLFVRREVILGCLVSFFIAVLSGGYNETFTVVQILLFAGITGYAWVFLKTPIKDRTLLFNYSALLGLSLAFLIMLTAPGTVNRQQLFSQSPNLVATFKITTVGYLQYIGGLFNSLEKILVWLGLFFISAWIGLQTKEKAFEGSQLPIPIIGGFLLAFASLLPAVYTTSEMPAVRTFVIPTFLILLGWMSTSLMLGGWLANKPNAVFPSMREVLLGVATLAFVLSAAINTTLFYADRGRYIQFAELWDSTNTMILQAKSNHERYVQIPAMDNWAGLERPTPSKKYWPNICYTLYYDIQVYGPSYSE